MIKKFQQAWDQMTLSPEADVRIRTAIEVAVNEKEQGSAVKKTIFCFSRTAVIAAVLASLLTVAACAVGITHAMFRAEHQSNGDLKVYFEKTTDEPIELGIWEPGDVPEGFEKVDTFRSDAVNLDTWENAAGESFIFSYEIPHDPDNITGYSTFPAERILKEEEVSINGSTASAYVFVNSEGNIHTNIYWTRPDSYLGFIITSFDLTVDELIPIAESVISQ